MFKVWIDVPTESNMVMDATAWTSDAERVNGFAPNTPAHSRIVNTALRQATLVTAALMEIAAPSAEHPDAGWTDSVENVKAAIVPFLHDQDGIQALVNTASAEAFVSVSLEADKLKFTQRNGTVITVDLSTLIPSLPSIASFFKACVLDANLLKFTQQDGNIVTVDFAPLLNAYVKSVTKSGNTLIVTHFDNTTETIVLEGLTGQATATALGGIKANEKTPIAVQEVKIDAGTGITYAELQSDVIYTEEIPSEDYAAPGDIKAAKIVICNTTPAAFKSGYLYFITA